MVDGAFDPLHAGHLAYLAAARTQGPLVCAVASDDQIREKGKVPFLTQNARVAVMEAIALVDYVYPKDRPTEQVIAKLRPWMYVKGPDWKDRLPSAQVDVLAQYGIPAWFPDVPMESSSQLLRAWALKDAEQSLERLEAFMSGQRPASEPWRPVTDYSFEARRKIEGPHAALVVSICDHSGDILDYGCGPEGHLVRMMVEEPDTSDRQIGVVGYDPQAPLETPWCPAARVHFTREMPHAERFEVVVCREVLEHCTVAEVADVVRNLFRLSSKYVYITTRFSNGGVFDADTESDVDPTHITCLSQPFLRSLCVLNGGKRRRDLETKLDHQNKGRVLVYEV